MTSKRDDVPLGVCILNGEVTIVPPCADERAWRPDLSNKIVRLCQEMSHYKMRRMRTFYAPRRQAVLIIPDSHSEVQ